MYVISGENRRQVRIAIVSYCACFFAFAFLLFRSEIENIVLYLSIQIIFLLAIFRIYLLSRTNRFSYLFGIMSMAQKQRGFKLVAIIVAFFIAMSIEPLLINRDPNPAILEYGFITLMSMVLLPDIVPFFNREPDPPSQPTEI